MTGGAGNDRLIGAADNDTLAGRLGDDTYVFSAASVPEFDTVTEAANQRVDTLSFAVLTTTVALNLAATATQTVPANRTLKLNYAITFENANSGSGDDILIAGRTTSDSSPGNLNTPRNEWISADSYANRITRLCAGDGSPSVSLIAKSDVVNDAGDEDVLTGGANSN